ncbi:fatty acid-binding protein homolog 5-like isoform X1 [Crassostrea virginica]|uniref:Fatty acid-binding protein homolog 5-like isoform X1 n=2 Tax=Crassostrea virginica TaxID=6565 RepID=A0A8B8EJR6_CRAVI|nr:fatty acid-binding protein homolog 5-like isoform X1 [Crassostrea virginica]
MVWQCIQILIEVFLFTFSVKMTKVLGHWKLFSSDDKWDEYMRTLGINFVLRKVGNSITSYEEMKQNGDQWELNITSTFKNAHLKFKLGEEFDETTLDGRKCKSTFVIEGEDLVHYQKGIKPGEVDSKITRTRVDDETMTITLEAIGKDLTTVRTFKKYTP